ncbi:ATP-grasp fold amidoligase family protein [Sutcliffiella horikoshii]|nr:ATP-grasp fold amidoligase family protein [Sutcliffiella horikoshii]
MNTNPKETSYYEMSQIESLSGEIDKEEERERKLLQILLKKDAEKKNLLRDNKRLEKECKKIRSTKIWQTSKHLNKISWLVSFLRDSINPVKKGINDELHQENNYLKGQVEVLKQEANRKKLLEISDVDDEGYNRESIFMLLKEAKDDGNFIELLDSIIDDKQLNQKKYIESLKYAAKLFKNERVELKNLVYSRVLSALPTEEIPEFIFRTQDNDVFFPFKEVGSFKTSMALQTRRIQFIQDSPQSILDDKRIAYSWVDFLGLRRPSVQDKTFTYLTIPRDTGVVIKPVKGSGSRGVYLVFEKDYIQDVRRGRILHGWEALTVSMLNDIETSWVENDEWMIEELILEQTQTFTPAKDLKFYCFYGKVALILEIQRFPTLNYCWWKPDGTRISTGKYENDLFKGSGFSEYDKEIAASLSSEIPAPFMRIDFLKTNNELVFGEFTPKPGNYDEFNSEIDTLLGNYYLDAESRLSADLINGKQFIQYQYLQKNRYNEKISFR